MSTNPLDNFRAAYVTLNDRVIRALRTQLGDAARLGDQRSEALLLLQRANEARALIKYLEFHISH